MPRLVKGPDGKTHRFPDTATDAQISAALKAIPEVNKAQAPKAPTWSERLGLNQPTDSVLGGLVRGAGAGVVDLTQGAVSNITGQLNTKLDAENEGRRGMGQPETVTLPRVEQPQNFSGTVGSALPVVAEVAMTGAPPAKLAYQAIPRAARAAEKFQDVMKAAKDVPIDVKDVGNVALRISELAERGGSMPKAVRDLLKRMTDPDKAPLAYGEARDFASNISRLSADEYGRLTPVVAHEVANLRVALNHANAMAAKQVGKMGEYASAMNEYARAMRLQGAVNAAVEGMKRVVPAASVGAGSYWLTQKVVDAIGQ